MQNEAPKRGWCNQIEKKDTIPYLCSQTHSRFQSLLSNADILKARSISVNAVWDIATGFFQLLLPRWQGKNWRASGTLPSLGQIPFLTFPSPIRESLAWRQTFSFYPDELSRSLWTFPKRTQQRVDGHKRGRALRGWGLHGGSQAPGGRRVMWSGAPV